MLICILLLSTACFSITEMQFVLPSNLAHLKLYSINDLQKKDYELSHKNSAKTIMDSDLKGLNTGFMTFLIKGDFNSNKKQDVAAIYRDPIENKYVYLIIFEKSKHKYIYIQHFKFKYYKAFLTNASSKIIYVYFQNQTDWMIKIKWNGNKYQIIPKDPYGP